MSQPEQGPDTARTARTALQWPADRHEAYLDSRPDLSSVYDPAAEYGDPDWREPASDAEAAARTDYLREHFPPAPGWTTRPLTPVEDALQDAQERAGLVESVPDEDEQRREQLLRWHDDDLRAVDVGADLDSSQETGDSGSGSSGSGWGR